MARSKPSTPEDLSPGQQRKINAVYRRLTGQNPAQAAAELAALLRGYGLRSWQGNSLNQLDHLACTALYVASHSVESSYWQGPDEHFRRGNCQYARRHETIAVYTPNQMRALVVTAHTRVPMPSAGARFTERTPRDSSTTETSWYVSSHTHRQPLVGIVTHHTWSGCCRLPEDLPQADFPELTKLLESRATVAEIATELTRMWQDIHGRATLVSLD